MSNCGGCDRYGTHDHPHVRYALTTNPKEPTMGWITNLFRSTPPAAIERTERTEPMTVRRIDRQLGSHIEPPLNDEWPEFDKLRWKAAVVSVDTDSHVEVQYQPLSCWPDLYEVHVPVYGPQRAMDYDAAIRMLMVYQRGCAAGREIEKRIAANSLQSLGGTFGAAPPAAPDPQ